MPECQVFLFRKNQPILPGFIISFFSPILCRKTGLLCSGGVAGFAPDYSERDPPCMVQVGVCDDQCIDG
jgi:hypothetical protein